MKKQDYPSAGQGVLAGLEAPDSLRHPLWGPPAADEHLTMPVRALREVIAKTMIPFDGRDDYSSVVIFAEQVYGDSAMDMMLTNNAYWLMGKVMMRRAELLLGLRRALQECQPVNQPIYRREIAVIERLGVEWTQAIADRVLS